MPTQTQAYTLYFTKMNFSIDFKMAGSKMKPAIIYLNQIISVYTKSEIIWYFHLYNATVTFFFATSFLLAVLNKTSSSPSDAIKKEGQRLQEEKEREILGWAKPFRFNLFSSSKAYFSWLLPNKKYEMGTNMHGGVRAFVLSDVYAKVLPMDIFPVFLIKACLAGDIDKMEQFGIYEVLPEDFALCEYVDPSKNEIQSIIQNGIDLMIKEMA